MISYQKLLQANYVNVFERNQKLESLLRQTAPGKAPASGDESESEASSSPHQDGRGRAGEVRLEVS